MEWCPKGADGMMSKRYRWNDVQKVQMEWCLKGADEMMFKRYKWNDVQMVLIVGVQSC